MRVIYAPDYANIQTPTGIVLGNFDGVHIGHQYLVRFLRNLCALENLESIVYTFLEHPQMILQNTSRKPLLTTNAQKIERLKQEGVDTLFFEEFNQAFSQLSPQDFVEKILVQKFHARQIVVGDNYRFGHGGKGDVHLLHKLSQQFGFQVHALPLLSIGQENISSTVVRKALLQAELDKSTHLLGRPFSITGVVQHGEKLGRKLGYPTANLVPREEQAVVKNGVYVTKTRVRNTFYNSLTNVGNRPTMRDEKFLVETFLLDFDGDLYDQEIEIYFLQYIREEKRFDTLSALVQEMDKDQRHARDYFRLFTTYEKPIETERTNNNE